MRSGAGARSTRLVVVVFATLLLLVGVVGVVLLRTMGVGAGGLGGATDRLEDWVGSQLVGIANAHLAPELAYRDIDYESPGTVTLGGVTLTAQDGTRVLELQRVAVTLAEAPKIGAPIVIERLTLDRPTVRLLRERREDGSAGFKGLSPLVERSPNSDDVPGEFRLSSVLRLRRIDINEGAFEYDAGDGSPPMTVGGLTTTVLAAPEQDDPGWYSVDILSAAGPLAELSARGVLSLDTFVARLDEVRLAGGLSPEAVAALPPPIQEVVDRYQAQGRFELTAAGTLPLTDPAGGQLESTLRLTGVRVVSGEYHVPVDAVDAKATLASGRLTLGGLRADLLRGMIEAYGDVDLVATGRPATLEWTIDGVDLRELLLTGANEDGSPKLAGTLSGAGSVATGLDSVRESITGSGELRVRDGRLAALPLVRALTRAMDMATARLLRGALDHTADGEFDLVPGGFSVRSLEVTTEAIAARGEGMIGFDGALDLRVNAGPLEKVQSLLGPVGEAIGAVTDRLVTYRVRGSVGAPEVTVEPLGIGG